MGRKKLPGLRQGIPLCFCVIVIWGMLKIDACGIWIMEQAENFYIPTLTVLKSRQETGGQQWIVEQIEGQFPLVQYVNDQQQYEAEAEDAWTVEKILQAQANDENAVDENGQLIGEDTTQAEAAAAPVPAAQIDLSMEALRSFEYLLGNFYTVDSSTMIDAAQLNVDDLMSRSMKINAATEGPKVLIFHTHSQETFADSIPGDTSTSIVGVGEYLTQLLNEKGIGTLHDTGVYDIIDGELDRSNAYENAEASVRAILEANPSIEVAIDLHRDGVNEGTHLVTEVNGKQTAQIMFFNGLSRTRLNGDIDYLYNPYIQDNLSFSFQMQLDCETYYPGFTRNIYLRGYRYNLHLLPKSLLIEAGAQTNTVEEMRNAMEVLSDTLSRVLL